MSSKHTPTYREIWITSGKHRLYGRLYLRDEQSPTILLLHGLGFHSFEYDALAPLLEKQGFNCLALDFRCCGRSEGKRGYWTLGDYVLDAKCAIDYIRKSINEEVFIFGNSLGAMVGVYAAADDRDRRIKKLIASNCATRPADFGLNTFRKFLLTIVRTLSALIPLRISVNFFIPYSKILSNPAIIDNIRTDRLITDSRKFAVSTYEDMFSWDATRIARNIRIPVLVLAQKGSDLLQTNAQSMLLFNALECPKTLTVIETGHVPDLENPELVSGIIVRWLHDDTLAG